MNATVETKVTRTRRVAIAGDQIVFTLPSGKTYALGRDAIHSLSHDKAWAYGVTQIYQDGLARGKDQPKATDTEARDLIERFVTGDWKATRTTGGPPTMEGVALRLVKLAKPGLKAEEYKTFVTAVLDESGNPKGFAKVKAQFDTELAAWSAGKDAADDLGI